MKNAGIWLAPALLCAFYLSAELVILGLDKFYYILAGGGKFATFPDGHSQLVIGFSYVALQSIYLIWFFSGRSRTFFSQFSESFRVSAIFLLTAFLSFPLGNDIYIYLHAGLMNLSQVNPFLVRAGSFLSELSPFVDWGQTSTYGPVSQLLFSLAAAGMSVHPILAVYLFKAFCLALHILNGYLVWTVLQPLPERSKITLAFLINPLLLFEQVGSAHIDVAVSTSLILLALCLVRQRYTLGFLSMWVGVFAKTLPLIWMPLVLLFLRRYQQGRSLLAIGLISGAIVLLLSLTVLPGLAAWSSLLNPGVEGQYKSSLHELVKFGLDWVRFTYPGTLTLAQERDWLLDLTRLTKLAFVGIYGVFAVKIWRQRAYSELHLIEDIGWATLILLLLATPWVMPWYASVMLTFAAVLPRSRLLGLTSLAFSFASSAQYLLLGLEGVNCLVAIGLPALTFLIASDRRLPRPEPGADVISAAAPASIQQPN